MTFDDAELRAKVAVVQRAFGPLPEDFVELVFNAIGFTRSMAIVPIDPTAAQLYAAHDLGGGPPALIYAVMVAAALEEGV